MFISFKWFPVIFVYDCRKWTWNCSSLKFFLKGTYLQVFISTKTYRGKHKGHLMEKNTFESLNQNLKWEKKLCKRWHAHRPMVRININVVNYLLYFSYFIEKIHPEAGGHTIEPYVPCWVNPPPNHSPKKLTTHSLEPQETWYEKLTRTTCCRIGTAALRIN